MTLPLSETPTKDAPYGIRPPGYRLPAATRLGAVRLQVADLARSLAWYRDVLGMRELRRDEGATILGAADGTPLVELVERAGVRPVPRRGLLGLYHYAILLPDRPSLGAFLAHLAERRVPAGMSDHFVSEAIYLTDPDGLGIEVYRDRPRAEWRAVDGQLAMATEPLDAMDVVSSATTRWGEMPAGTAIGHVHLHVGDLARGAALYHDVLGFDKVVWSYPGALFLSAGGYHHHLGTNTWAASSPSAGDEDARLLEWRIDLPSAADVDDVARSAAERGASAVRDGDGIVLADAFGTRVRVRAGG